MKTNREMLADYVNLYDTVTNMKEAEAKLHIFPNNIIKIGLIIDMIELGAAFKIEEKDEKMIEIISENKICVPISFVKQLIGQNFSYFENIIEHPENNTILIDEVRKNEEVAVESSEQTVEEDNWENLPTYYEEGNTKRKDNFVYECRNISVTDKESGEYETYEVCIYPETIPRNVEDKIRTVVTVKNKKSKNVFIGATGISTKAEFFDGKCVLGFRIVVNEDGTLSTKTTVSRGRDKFSIVGDVKKPYNSKIKEAKNSHMIIQFKGQDVHVFPINYEKNDMSGIAETVCLVGADRRAIVPEKENLIPVDGNDGTQTKLKFFWKGENLTYDI